MSYTPIFVPLVKGLDLSVESMLGGGELTVASNIDFSVQGQARGRPSRAATAQFLVRDPAGTVLAPSYKAPSTLAASGFTACGLLRHRDATGERALLATHGRLFAKEASEWKDRGAFGCLKVDQPHTFYAHSTSALTRLFVGPDFGAHSLGNDGSVALLNKDSLSFEQIANLSNVVADVGTMARCGNFTAAVYNSSTLPNRLRIVIRNNGASTLTDAILATDAAATSDNGDAPVICCDLDQTAFFVVYQTTVANQYKVLKVTTAGSVSATFTGSLSNIHGHWVTNSTVADNKVLVALTSDTGLTIKVLNATTMADLSTDSTHGAANWDGKEVVIGCESSGRAWWAYRSDAWAATFVAGLYIGTVNPGSASSAVLARTYYYQGAVDGASNNTNGTELWTPMHQPVKVGGRMYLTIGGAPVGLAAGTTEVGTWQTLDLSNMKVGSATDIGPFEVPTIVARGRVLGTAFKPTALQPEGAVVLSAGTGWTFPSVDWVSYETDWSGDPTGQQAMTVLNKVTLSQPRCVQVGNSTIFSGSVPRSLAGDQCYDHGPLGAAPAVYVEGAAGGGVLTGGSYTVYGVWSYVDGAGQRHRSAARGATVSVSTNDRIKVWVENPYWSERQDVKLEVYCTAVNPTGDDQAFLQTTAAPVWTKGSTLVTLGASALNTVSEGLYVLDDEFSHTIPSADGGAAAVGRRVWVAGGNTVHGSLLLEDGKGSTWSDEGSLSVTLPVGAGRVLALEGLHDKLLVFCARGVYALQDGGPDNVGQGPDIAFPIRVSDLGCAGPRATCATDRGVVFVSPLDSTDPQRGGPWFISESERRYLGSPAMGAFLASGTWTPEVAFSPERQQVYITSNQVASQDPPTIGSAGGAVTLTDAAASEGVVVLDVRADKWSSWDLKRSWGTLRHVDVVSGVLWALNDEPAPFSGAPGSDASGGDYSMRVRTSHMAGNGQDGAGWARVRSVSPLAAIGATTHTLGLFAWADEERCMTSGSLTQTTPSVSGTWPTTRLLDEWRLPTQKCSTLQVELQASPATARWAAIRLDVQPLPRRAPARTRT